MESVSVFSVVLLQTFCFRFKIWQNVRVGNVFNISYSKDLGKRYTGLPTKDESIKTTQNSKNMTVLSLNFGVCIQLSSLMV